MHPPALLKRPIEYHTSLRSNFDYWTEHLGRDLRRLLAATAIGIRNANHCATVSTPGGPHRPCVYQLRLGDMIVYYTVESLAVIVRGYASLRPLRPDEVRDDMSDGFHCDNHWDHPELAQVNPTCSAEVSR